MDEILNDELVISPPMMDDPLKDFQTLDTPYVEPVEADSGSYNGYILFIVIAVVALIYKFRKQIHGDDEDQFLKPGRDNYQSYSNPFNRRYDRSSRRDKDNDDYDRHV